MLRKRVLYICTWICMYDVYLYYNIMIGGLVCVYKLKYRDYTI